MIHHINKIKNKNHVIISIDTEKAKIKFKFKFYAFVIKALQKVDIKGNYLNKRKRV